MAIPQLKKGKLTKRHNKANLMQLSGHQNAPFSNTAIEGHGMKELLVSLSLRKSHKPKDSENHETVTGRDSYSIIPSVNGIGMPKMRHPGRNWTVFRVISCQFTNGRKVRTAAPNQDLTCVANSAHRVNHGRIPSALTIHPCQLHEYLSDKEDC
jgi:hypothetical protein